MDNFLISLNAVLPLALSMGVGVFLRRARLVTEATAAGMNHLIFRLFLPTLLFSNIYRANLSAAADGRALLIAAGGAALSFFLLFFVVRRTRQSPPRKGVILQGCIRTNVALFGLPIAIHIYGAEKAAPIALVISIVIPLYNMLSVLSFELFRREKVHWGHLLKGIVTNPNILGVTLALVVNALPWSLPQALAATVSGFAGVATPLSFLVMGASLRFASAAQNRGVIGLVCLFKLALYPLFWVGAAIAAGLRGPLLLGITLVFASPVATSIFPMAASMGGDADLACELVALTSLLSMFTVFLWIFCLKGLALI